MSRSAASPAASKSLRSIAAGTGDEPVAGGETGIDSHGTTPVCRLHESHIFMWYFFLPDR